MKHVSTLTALIVQPGESTPRVSSRKIAEAFDKNHRDVLRKIDALVSECPSAFGQRNFALSNYLNQQGKTQPEYLLTRDAFCLLVMGFSGQRALTWKVRYIEAFNQMEQAIRNQHLLTSPEGVALIQRGLKLSCRLTPERKLEIKRAVRYQALGLSKAEVGRLLGCGPTKAGNLLREHRWLKGGE